jgi:hypothetical protein
MAKACEFEREREFAKALEQSTAPGLTLLESDDLVLLSPTKEGLQQHIDILHWF